MDNELQLLSIGDASMDVFMIPSESETLCKIKEKECLLCFDYGDKIPVSDLQFSVGGNAANNAVGTRRLGVNSAAVLSLGEDDTGRQIKDKLAREGVGTEHVVLQANTRSNYSTIINVGGERTLFSYKGPRDYNFPSDLSAVPWVYLTSMGDTFRPFYRKVLEWVEVNGQIKLAFNPGSRQIRAVEDILEVLKVCYIVYVNRREAELITGMSDTHGKEKELLKALSEKGPKIPIVTDGGNGAYVYDGIRYLHSGVLPVDAYERTGAGDAFGAGCVAALIKGKSFDEALLWGTVNSASVIGFIGSQKGLLKEEDLPVWLERARSCEVKVEEI